MIKDVGMRALKTFFQAFFAVVIPQIVMLLNTATEVDWASWNTYMPIICGAIAAGLSAIQNGIINASKAKEIDQK